MRRRKILVPQPRSRFVKIKCPDCGNVQVTFSHASTEVKCHACGRTLVKPRGGKAEILAEIVEYLR